MKKSLLLTMGTLLFASLASASTVTSTCGGAQTGPTDINKTFTCATFNSTLGNLTAMTLEVDGSIIGSIALTNTGQAPQTLSATEASQFFLGALAGYTIPSPLFTASYSTGVQTINGGDTFNSGTLNGSGTVTMNAASLLAFITSGAGTFNANVFTLSGLTLLGAGGNLTAAQVTNASANILVTYTYDIPATTPEPSSLLMMGSALIGLGAMKFRKRS